MLSELLKELPGRRDPNPFHTFRLLAAREIDGITGERDRALLAGIDRSVRRQVEWDRRFGRISYSRRREVEDPHGPTLQQSSLVRGTLK